MLKRVAVLGLLAPLTLGNLSRPVEAAGLGGLAALFLLGNLPSAADAGWGHGGGFHRPPYYPRHYGGFYRDGGYYRDGGFYHAPYYAGYGGAPYGGYGGYGGYSRCPPYGYGNYGGYDGYGYDDYGW